MDRGRPLHRGPCRRCADKTRRTRTVPGPYPKIIKLPRVPEAPDRPATGVLLYDTDLSGRDLVFFQTAHEAGLHQLALAGLARERADSAQIKSVAETARHHAGRGKQTAPPPRFAQGPEPCDHPSRPIPPRTSMGSRVKFDEQWIERLVAVNTIAVTAYESGTQSADSEIKAFAEAMLPLAQAKLQIASRLAGKAPAAAANRSAASPRARLSGRAQGGGETISFPPLQQRVRHRRGRRRDGDAGGLQRGDFSGGGAFAAGDDGAGVAHAAAGRSGGAGDEGGDRLLAMVLSPRGGAFLGIAADFADHDDGFGLGIVVEHLQHVEMARAVDGIAADADASAIARSRASVSCQTAS